jgi:hypothetical protein
VVATIVQLSRDLCDTYSQLFERGPRRFSFNDFVASVAIALAMAAIFGALLVKFFSRLQIEHRSLCAYTVFVFVITIIIVSVLNNFGIQAPFNESLSLVQNLAHAVNSNDVILTGCPVFACWWHTRRASYFWSL